MSKVVAPAGTFGAALQNAALFASTNKTRPILCCALVNWTPDEVEIIATDSYGLLVQRFDRTDGDDSGTVQIDRDDLIAFAKLAKADKLNDPARLQVEGDDLTFKVGRSSAGGHAFTYGDFPNVKQIIPGDLDSVPLTAGPSEVGCAWGLPIAWFATLGKLATFDRRKAASIVIRSGETALKPCAFELSTEGRVFGLVMPVRLP